MKHYSIRDCWIWNGYSQLGRAPYCALLMAKHHLTSNVRLLNNSVLNNCISSVLDQIYLKNSLIITPLLYLQRPGNPLHRLWPFQEDLAIRTRQQVLNAVREVERTNQLVCSTINVQPLVIVFSNQPLPFLFPNFKPNKMKSFHNFEKKIIMDVFWFDIHFSFSPVRLKNIVMSISKLIRFYVANFLLSVKV